MSNPLQKFVEIDKFFAEHNQDEINEYLFYRCKTFCPLEEIRYMVSKGANPRMETDAFFAQHNQDEIDEYFLTRCEKHFPLSEIKYMVSKGANPRMENDEPFIASCGRFDVNVPLYFLNECGADINAQNGKALVLSCTSPYAPTEIIAMLLEAGIMITAKAIMQAVIKENKDILGLMVKHGASIEDITRLYWNYLNIENHGCFQMLNFLKESGIDLDQSLGAYRFSI